MKQRELINLPLGKYSLSDGIWDYSLVKTLTERDSVIYVIKELQSGNLLCLFEGYKKEDGITYKILSALVHVGGIPIHSYDFSDSLRRLKFKPNSSYNQTFGNCITESRRIN